tara:strand:- start:979 stop:1386 length:408 start_codon:yes stop_codon:yes gene_type:complete
MPSYYDSSKKKPGKAKVKYAEGGQVRRSDPEKRESVRKREATARGERRADRIKRVEGEQARDHQKEWSESKNPFVAGLRSLHNKIDEIDRRRFGRTTSEGLGRSGGNTQKRSGGGQLKVTGMGAATRGGNFTRNG